MRRALISLLISATVLGVAALLINAAPASAQEADEVLGEVDISFVVGEYDPALDDWAVTAVEVSGDLEDGRPFTVTVTGAGGEELWAATQAFDAPVMQIPVNPVVGVGEITAAGVSQPLVEVGGAVVERPQVDWSRAGGGGSGQLALSIILAILVVAIVFRTPLPSATSQRWTK